jgi:flagellar biosynthesis protein FliP
LIASLSDVLQQGVDKTGELSTALRILIMLTALSLIPVILIATTSFLRIIIVLSMLRHAQIQLCRRFQVKEYVNYRYPEVRACSQN